MAHPQTPEPGTENPEYYAEDARNPMTERDFLLLLQTPDASTQNTEDDCSLLEQFLWEENNSADTSETPEENRKRNILNEEKITHDTDAQKRSRPGVCETNDRATFDFSENGYINPDSQTNEITMSSQMALAFGSLASLNLEFLNYEESNPKNQEIKAFDYLGKVENWSIGQCTAHNKNIFQKENETAEIKNTGISKAANVCSVDDRIVVPGTSDCRENNSNSKLCAEKVENGSQLKQQPPVKTKQIQPLCLSCKKTVSNHLVIDDGKDKYKCCKCILSFENFNYLQMHVYILHTKRFYCYVCQMKYSELGTHASDQMCDVCNQNFECKYQLEDHCILAHKDFLETHCRICKKGFGEHFSKAVEEYQCCFRECKYQHVYPYGLSIHVYTHTVLKIFKCEICENRFKRFEYLSIHLKNDHPVCNFCEKRFVNIFFLNEHRCKQHREELS